MNERAINWVRNLLQLHGPLPVATVRDEAQSAGWKWTTIYKASRALEVEKIKERVGWVWYLRSQNRPPIVPRREFPAPSTIQHEIILILEAGGRLDPPFGRYRKYTLRNLDGKRIASVNWNTVRDMQERGFLGVDLQAVEAHFAAETPTDA